MVDCEYCDDREAILQFETNGKCGLYWWDVCAEHAIDNFLGEKAMKKRGMGDYEAIYLLNPDGENVKLVVPDTEDEPDIDEARKWALSYAANG